MAIHTGEAELRAADYYGNAVNRCARLRSAAPGGQTVLSSATQELVRDHLPGEVSLRDLGNHRLKDLARPERIFQLLVAGVPSESAPLETLDVRPNNLPVQPTPFIGREQELRQLCDLLMRDSVRLVTLTGPGGTGKTRLSLQAAAEVLSKFLDGAYSVDLSPLSEPELVLPAIAQTLGVTEGGDQSLAAAIMEHLTGKELLLVLDNFEQVSDAAPQISALLNAPGLKVLTTSRIPLRIAAEREFPVPSLSLPDVKRDFEVEALSQYEAVRLFIERAQAVRPDFTVTNENAPAVAEICVRLDGLPLAIELAAARVRMLPPQALLSRLDSRLRLLIGGARDLPERQRTLRGAIDWSHTLLCPEEQVLFARLAVFAGTHSLEAAEAVCDPDGDLDAFQGLESLLEKSLLRRAGDAGGDPRLLILQTIQEYACERLEASGEAGAVRGRHAEYFLTLAETAEPNLTGPQQQEWLDRLEAERDNLRAALSWLLESQSESGARLASALGRFWYTRSDLQEGSRWLEAVLVHDGLDSRLRAGLTRWAGVIAAEMCDFSQSREHLEKSRLLFTELGDRRGMAAVLNSLGVIEREMGNAGRALELLRESLAIKRELGDRPGVSTTLGNLGVVAIDQREWASAREYLEESLALEVELGNTWGEVVNLHNLGGLALGMENYAEADRMFRRVLPLLWELGDKDSVIRCIWGLGIVASATGDHARAARLWGAADTHRRAIGTAESPVDVEESQRRQDTTRSQLGDGMYETEWRIGQALSLDAAMTYALANEASSDMA
jgi:predicted ATPase